MAKKVIVNGDDSNTLDAVKGMSYITYGENENCNYRAADIKYGTKTAGEYDLYHNGEFMCHIAVSVPGKHNISNSLAAASIALENGISPEDVAKYLPNFKGAGRRFEILDEIGGITVADDYAHHPTELEVTLNAAMNMGYNTVYAVFQPFTYSRTAMLLDDFARVLKIADKTVLSEIMGSREINTYNIYSKDLAEKIPGSIIIPDFEDIAQYLAENAKEGDLIITLGCGDIYKAAKILVEKLKEKY